MNVESKMKLNEARLLKTRLQVITFTLSQVWRAECVSVSAGIPQMAIITHIDEACGETEKDLRNVYKSKHLKKKVSLLTQEELNSWKKRRRQDQKQRWGAGGENSELTRLDAEQVWRRAEGKTGWRGAPKTLKHNPLHDKQTCIEAPQNTHEYKYTSNTTTSLI